MSDSEVGDIRCSFFSTVFTRDKEYIDAGTSNNIES